MHMNTWSCIVSKFICDVAHTIKETNLEYGYSLIVESKEYANICNTIYCCNVSSMQSNKTVLYMFRITTSEVYRTIDALLQFLHVTY